MNSFFLLINSELAVLSRSALILSECWAEDSQHDVKFLTWSWEKRCSVSELSAASLLFSHRQLLFSVSPIFLPTAQSEFQCLVRLRNSTPLEGDTQRSGGAAVRLPVWFSSRTNRFPQQRPDSSALKHHLSTRAELSCCDKMMGNWAQLPPSGQMCVTAAVTCLQRTASILWSCIGESG